MELSFYTTDLFTDQVFAGAPIMVFPQAEGLTDQQMLSLAREMCRTETVFVLPADSDENHFRLRVFNSLGERTSGSHSTIAAAHVLASIGAIVLNDMHTAIRFEHNKGVSQTHITQEDGKPVFTQISQTVKPIIDNYVPSDTELANILSLEVADIANKKFSSLMVATERRYLIVPIRSFDAVRKARFNYKAWNQSSAPSSMIEEVLLFSQDTEQIGSNFHARLLGPDIAIHDDPPVGGATPAFAAYLCAHKHVRKGTYIFSLERGTTDSRQSILNVEMDNKGLETLTVRIGGKAILSAKGTAFV